MRRLRVAVYNIVNAMYVLVYDVVMNTAVTCYVLMPN